MPSNHEHARHEHSHHEHGDAPDLVTLLDLDAEVLHDYLAEVIAWTRELAGERPRPRILDLGSGSGTGAIALAQSFEGAEVTAVDSSEPMLEHLRRRSRELGLADRIHTLRADLDAAWPALEPVDVAWASASLHHLADPDRVLADIFATVRPGGVLAVAELDSFPRFLPADLGFGRPGLEARLHELADAARAEQLPHIGADWGPRLSKAGFVVEGERHFSLVLTDPLPAGTVRYAETLLGRLRASLGDRLDADDRASLDTLLAGNGPDSLAHRADLTVRAARTVWMGRRP